MTTKYPGDLGRFGVHPFEACGFRGTLELEGATVCAIVVSDIKPLYFDRSTGECFGNHLGDQWARERNLHLVDPFLGRFPAPPDTATTVCVAGPGIAAQAREYGVSSLLNIHFPHLFKAEYHFGFIDPGWGLDPLGKFVRDCVKQIMRNPNQMAPSNMGITRLLWRLCPTSPLVVAMTLRHRLDNLPTDIAAFQLYMEHRRRQDPAVTMEQARAEVDDALAALLIEL